jgi:hypothetical protein
MDTAQASQVMQQANKIIEDFSVGKYALYLFIFAIETALCFWLALNI